MNLVSTMVNQGTWMLRKTTGHTVVRSLFVPDSLPWISSGCFCLFLAGLLHLVRCRSSAYERRRQRRQQGDRGIGDGLGGLEQNVGDQEIAGLAVTERHERLLLAGAERPAALQHHHDPRRSIAG